VLKASKKVKNSTDLSSGTTSVSYAAVQYIIDTVPDFSKKKVLVYGLGDIGKNTCKNLIEYAKIENITLINRTLQKAEEFVQEHPLVKINSTDNLAEEIANSYILIVSTGADVPTVTGDHVGKNKELLVLDLSLPENVASEVKNMKTISMVNIDELSKITNKTIAGRKKEIPKAEKIIAEHKLEFMEWIAHRKFTPAVSALKASLESIQKDEIEFQKKKNKIFDTEQAEAITSRMIQKITTQFVKHLKSEDTSVNQSIDVVKKMFEMDIKE
jgi:glutamyl-tRNA reductase